MQTAFAAIATLAAAAFSVAVFRQYAGRRRPYQLAWGISLAMFALASLALTLGANGHWTVAGFKVYYLFGAILTVPWLALGEVLLLGSRRTASAYLVALLLFSAAAIGLMLATTIPPAALSVPAGKVPNGNDFLPAAVRTFAATGGAVGTIIVVGGAVVSAFRMRGRRNLKTRFEGTLLIAVGVLVAASGGVLTFLGDAAANAVALAVGATVMFIGFVRASRPIPAPAGESAGGTLPRAEPSDGGSA